MISHDGIIDVAEFCPSPNFDERPNNVAIDLIVIHAISLPAGRYNTHLIKDLFLNCLDPDKDEFLESIKDIKVSPHFLITRKGKLIQFVPMDKRAWHAGISIYKGRENCNDFSIGIELEGCDKERFEEEQYFALQELTRFLLKQFSIPKEAIVGHADIAPNRKTDPGPYFAWDKYTDKL